MSMCPCVRVCACRALSAAAYTLWLAGRALPQARPLRAARLRCFVSAAALSCAHMHADRCPGRIGKPLAVVGKRYTRMRIDNEA